MDTKGNPMSGVKVRADNDALYGSAEVITDANGRYTLPKLEIGGWKIYAWKEVTYKGKTYPSASPKVILSGRVIN